MKFFQYIGPFISNQTITIQDATFLQIGVEKPQSAPISEISDWPPSFTIGINKGNQQNERDFLITDRDVLEFELNHESVNLIIYEYQDPYLIINVAYEGTN